MSVEIRELVIRATVSEPVENCENARSGRSRELSPRDIERIVTACLRRMTGPGQVPMKTRRER